MGQSPGGPSYDGDAMRAIARDSRTLSSDLGNMRQHLSEKTMTSAAFGRIGDQSNVKGVFDGVWESLTRSLGTGSGNVNGLAGGVESSFAEMNSRDDGNAQNLKQSGEVQ